MQQRTPAVSRGTSYICVHQFTSKVVDEDFFAHIFLWDCDKPGVNLTKLFFFGNEEFFCFLLLSLAVVQYKHFFHMLQTLKLISKNRKTGKMKVWQDRLLGKNIPQGFVSYLSTCLEAWHLLSLCTNRSNIRTFLRSCQKMQKVASNVYVEINRFHQTLSGISKVNYSDPVSKRLKHNAQSITKKSYCTRIFD